MQNLAGLHGPQAHLLAAVCRHGSFSFIPLRGIHSVLPCLSNKGGLRGNGVIGVRRETKNRWERRAPITPKHVRTLRRNDIQVYIQPSSMRVFTNEQYENAGAIVTEDLSPASLILGVKEVPISDIIPDRTYMCFSHTIKAQPVNMPMLDAIMEKNVRLIDYETLVDSSTGKRVVGFGRFAGAAGMIDLLRALGDRLLGLGHSTPFLGMGYADYYHSLWGAKTSLHVVGQNLQIAGLPRPLSPFVFAFTGSGNVTDGALEIFQELPHEFISVHDLPYVINSQDNRTLYGVKLEREDLVQHKDGRAFDKDHYNKHPEEYEDVFHKNIAPHITALVHGMYWDDRFPRLLTFENTRELYRNGNPRLLAIADISADPNGSIEFTTFCTTIDRLYLVYNPETMQHVYDWEAEGILLGSVDNLPAEFPVEASVHFGDLLLPYLPDLAWSNGELPFEQQNDRATIHNAVITSNGKLTPNFQGIAAKRAENEQNVKKILVLGSGMVAGPAIEHLAIDPDVHVTVASDDLQAAKSLAESSGAAAEEIDISDPRALSALVRRHDVVISLIPAPLHPMVAEACIDEKVHMVTSSYVSPEMEALNDRAQAAGVTVLNEIGLDPGIDHLMAMKMVDEVHAQGGKVLSFSSWCGGLPSAEASGNALGYKCSWSVKAFLSAGLNDASFRENGENIVIPGDDLFGSARDIGLLPGLRLEGYPNRDSLKYQGTTERMDAVDSLSDVYGLDDAETVVRGTLRYKGFCRIMAVFNKLGLMNTAADDRLTNQSWTWRELIADVVGNEDPVAGVHEKLKGQASEEDIESAVDAMDRLGLLSGQTVVGGTFQDAMANILGEQLAYGTGERDLVLLQHAFEVAKSDGSRETINMTLVRTGTPNGHSAMAVTVGLPAAMAAKLVARGGCDHGVLRPLAKSIYEPLLEELAANGVTYTTDIRKVRQ